MTSLMRCDALFCRLPVDNSRQPLLPLPHLIARIKIILGGTVYERFGIHPHTVQYFPGGAGRYVTGQAISMWENGKKEIPPRRKEELARFFGIDEAYFGEISESQKQALLRRAMFRHDVNDREAYRFRPEDGTTSLKGVGVLFLPESEQSFDEQYVDAQKRKKRTLEEISALIDGPS